MLKYTEFIHNLSSIKFQRESLSTTLISLVGWLVGWLVSVLDTHSLEGFPVILGGDINETFCFNFHLFYLNVTQKLLDRTNEIN